VVCDRTRTGGARELRVEKNLGQVRMKMSHLVSGWETAFSILLAKRDIPVIGYELGFEGIVQFVILGTK
jgi:hypothetical protein